MRGKIVSEVEDEEVVDSMMAGLDEVDEAELQAEANVERCGDLA